MKWRREMSKAELNNPPDLGPTLAYNRLNRLKLRNCRNLVLTVDDPFDGSIVQFALNNGAPLRAAGVFMSNSNEVVSPQPGRRS
jgi:hypothetical protein